MKSTTDIDTIAVRLREVVDYIPETPVFAAFEADLPEGRGCTVFVDIDSGKITLHDDAEDLTEAECDDVKRAVRDAAYQTEWEIFGKNIDA